MIETIAVVAAALAAVAAMITAWLAYRQAKAAHSANRAHVFLDFSNRYNDPEITRATSTLIRWRRNAGKKFDELWFSAFTNGEPEAVELNNARRNLNRYFDDIARAHQAGILDKTLARVVASHFGLLVYYDIAVPMSRRMLGVRYDDLSHVLREIVPDFSGRTRLDVELV